MDRFEELKMYKELLDKEIITQEEFEQKKIELLGVGTIDSQEKTASEKEPLNDSKEESAAQIIENETDEQVASSNEASISEQKSASRKGAILVGIVGVFVLLIIIAIIGSFGSGGIKGSWNCSSVVYQGEKLDASAVQADDYTMKFTDSTFDANIYGVQTSGTYKYSDTITLDDGKEVDLYTLTTDGGAELTVAYYKSENVLTLSPFGGVSSSTFIEFKRR